MIEISIAVNGVERTYQGDYDELHNNNWNEIVQERLDEALAEEKTNHDQI